MFLPPENSEVPASSVVGLCGPAASTCVAVIMSLS